MYFIEMPAVFFLEYFLDTLDFKEKDEFYICIYPYILY